MRQVKHPLDCWFPTVACSLLTGRMDDEAGEYNVQYGGLESTPQIAVLRAFGRGLADSESRGYLIQPQEA
jgi:hypothetical protein